MFCIGTREPYFPAGVHTVLELAEVLYRIINVFDDMMTPTDVTNPIDVF